MPTFGKKKEKTAPKTDSSVQNPTEIDLGLDEDEAEQTTEMFPGLDEDEQDQGEEDGTVLDLPEQGVMSSEDFKKATYVRAAKRGNFLSQIDDALKNYDDFLNEDPGDQAS